MEVGEEEDTVVVVAVATRGTQVCEACVGATRSTTCSCGRDDGGITDPVAWSLVARNAAGDLVGFAARVTEETAMLAAKGVANVSLNTTIGGVVGGVGGAVSGAVTGLFWTALSAVRLGLSASVSLVSYLAQKGVQVVRGPNGSSVLRIPGETPEAPVSEVQLLHLDADEYHRRQHRLQRQQDGSNDGGGGGGDNANHAEGEHDDNDDDDDDDDDYDDAYAAAATRAMPGSVAARHASAGGRNVAALSGMGRGGVAPAMAGPSVRAVACQTEMLGWKPKADNPQSFVNFLHVPTAKVQMGDMLPLADRTRVSQQPTGATAGGAAEGEGVEGVVKGKTAEKTAEKSIEKTAEKTGASDVDERVRGAVPRTEHKRKHQQQWQQQQQQQQRHRGMHYTQSLGSRDTASLQGGAVSSSSLPSAPRPSHARRHQGQPQHPLQQQQQEGWMGASAPVARDDATQRQQQQQQQQQQSTTTTATTTATASVGMASAPPLLHHDGRVAGANAGGNGGGGNGGGIAEREADGGDVEVSPGGTRRQRKRWVIPNTAPDINPTAPAMGE